ncbi:MAG: PIN domain-containing protein [Treponema sp.]|nr:PIN domain-containing protein [Treponema sp.]
MKAIVFDTSAIYASHFLENELGILKAIKDNYSELNIKLITPEIVLDESINKLKDSIKEINSYSKKIQSTNAWKLANKLNNSFSIIRDELCDDNLTIKMENTLKNEIKTLGDILPYPTITHKEVVQRALNRNKPFDSEGHNGYRDTIIWESLKTLLLRSDIDEVYFICRNPKDFFEKESYNNPPIELYESLQKELDSLNISHKLLCYKDFSSAYSDKIKDSLEDIENFYNAADFIKSERFMKLLSNQISESNFDEEFFKQLIQFTYDSFDVMYVGPTEIKNIISAKRTGDHIGLFEIECELEINLDVYIYKWDYDFEEHGSSVEDWNDSYFLTDLNEYETMTLIIELDYETNTILSVSVSS